jgi:uncharacterized protein (TIGR03435 family)
MARLRITATDVAAVRLAGIAARWTDPGDLIKAFEKQLGLRIQKTTAPFELIAIDHAERTPTEN